MIQFEASIIAAWWGAIIASIVLLWDMFKWFNKGAKISINAIPNMRIVNDIESDLDDKKIIFAEVFNMGEMPTTITHLALYQYKSRIKKMLNKPIRLRFTS